MSATPFTCDSERLTFLSALVEAKVPLSEFESQFVSSAQRYQAGAILFSDRQRAVCDRMFRTYGHRMQTPNSKLQTPVGTVADRLPPSVDGQCDWLIRCDGAIRQTRCGQAAAEGRRFCTDHEQERASAAARLREANRRRH